MAKSNRRFPFAGRDLNPSTLDNTSKKAGNLERTFIMVKSDACINRPWPWFILIFVSIFVGFLCHVDKIPRIAFLGIVFLWFLVFILIARYCFDFNFWELLKKAFSKRKRTTENKILDFLNKKQREVNNKALEKGIILLIVDKKQQLLCFLKKGPSSKSRYHFTASGSNSNFCKGLVN